MGIGPLFSIFSRPAPSQLLQTVQGEAKGGGEPLQKPLHLRHFHPPQGLQRLSGGVGELVVAAFELLQALDVGGELVGGLDDPA